MKPKTRYMENGHRIYSVDYGKLVTLQVDLDSIFPYRVLIGDWPVPFLTRKQADNYFKHIERNYVKAVNVQRGKKKYAELMDSIGE